jgi:hypothetical protein
MMTAAMVPRREQGNLVAHKYYSSRKITLLADAAEFARVLDIRR